MRRTVWNIWGNVLTESRKCSATATADAGTGSTGPAGAGWITGLKGRKNGIADAAAHRLDCLPVRRIYLIILN